MKEIDFESLNSLGLFKAKKQVELKLCELDLLKNDPAQRQFILTRIIEKNGRICWGFNINSIITNLTNIMEFPNFNSKFEKPTLFIGGELSHYIT
jgi:abhydrolase domain-containing protein 11